jgi:hypothetical protein
LRSGAVTFAAQSGQTPTSESAMHLRRPG